MLGLRGLGAKLRAPWWLVIAVVGSAAIPACSCGESETTQPTGPGSTSSSGGGGAGGSGGDQGGGGAGGQGGGGGPQASGPGTTNFVNAGQTVSSPSYKMVFTFGQSTPTQGKATSPSYRVQGGLQGANGTLP
jgi:hypothetical protein